LQNYGHLSWLIIGLQQEYKKLDFGDSQTDAEADLKFIDMVELSVILSKKQMLV
jgi:hypothetical protein